MEGRNGGRNEGGEEMEEMEEGEEWREEMEEGVKKWRGEELKGGGRNGGGSRCRKMDGQHVPNNKGAWVSFVSVIWTSLSISTQLTD
jgi:hypothetical protein